jgi:hypothetical protein
MSCIGRHGGALHWGIGFTWRGIDWALGALGGIVWVLIGIVGH